MRRLLALPLILAVLGAPGLVGCSSTDSGAAKTGAVGVGDYRGLLTGGSETGVLDVTLSAAASTQSLRRLSSGGSETATGTIEWVGGGTKVVLSGSYDAASGVLTLSGTTSSGKYSLTGKASGSTLQGTYSGPKGSGSFSLLPALSGAVTLYCGTYAGDASGAWNLAIDASGEVIGSHCDTDTCGVMTGTVSGDAVTLSDPETGGTTKGTRHGSTINGTWDGKGNSGTWQGSEDACNTASDDHDAGPTGSGGAGGTGAGGASAGGASAGGASDGGALGVDAGADGSVPEGGDARAPAPVSIASGLTDPFELSSDDAFVYFYTSSEVHRCPIAGCASGTGDKMVGPLAVPSSVVTTGDALFWTHDFHQIDTCAVSASPGCTAATFADTGANSYPAHLRVKNGLVYWISESGTERRVQVCPTTGCTTGYPKTILDSADASLLDGASLSGLALTDANVFLLNFGGPIYHFSMTDPETVDAASGVQVAGSAYGSGGLDVDGASLFWGIVGDGKVESCTAPACSSIVDFRSGLGSTAAVSVGPSGLFVADRGTSNGSGGYVAGTGNVWLVAR